MGSVAKGPDPFITNIISPKCIPADKPGYIVVVVIWDRYLSDKTRAGKSLCTHSKFKKSQDGVFHKGSLSGCHSESLLGTQITAKPARDLTFWGNGNLRVHF